MARIIKTISGHRYVYDVTWDKVQKRRIWRYVGKFEKDYYKQENARVINRGFLDKLLDSLYNRVKRDSMMNLTKKQLKRFRHHIKNFREIIQ